VKRKEPLISWVQLGFTGIDSPDNAGYLNVPDEGHGKIWSSSLAHEWLEGRMYLSLVEAARI